VQLIASFSPTCLSFPGRAVTPGIQKGGLLLFHEDLMKGSFSLCLWFLVVIVILPCPAQDPGGPFIFGLVEQDEQEWQLEVMRDSVWQHFSIPLSEFGSGEEFLNTPVTMFKLVPVGGGTFGLSSEVTDWIDHVVLGDSVIDDFDDGDYEDWDLMLATNGSYLDILADSTAPDGSDRCLKLVHGNSLQGGFLGWLEKNIDGLVLSDDDTLRFWLRGISYLVSGVGNVQPSVPWTHGLLWNYPNPFNLSTRIVYAIRSRELVVLRIYDLLGREVATLVNEAKDPGAHEVVWDASGRASGTYVCVLRTGSAAGERLLVLVR
jgi:hypothetical protein